MARTGLILGAAAALGLGVADLSYLNLRLVPEVLGEAPAPDTPAVAGAAQVAPMPGAGTPEAASAALEPPAARAAEPSAEPSDAPIAEPSDAPIAEPSDAPAAEPNDEPATEPADRAPLPERTVLHFESGSATLSAEAADQLDRLADRVRDQDQLRLVIAGHADERGSRTFNRDLGERRAERVVRYLADRGLPEDRMSWRSFGESRPADQGRAPASLRRNRRVEIDVKRGQP